MEKKQRGSESKAKQELGWGVLRQSPAKDTVRSHFPAPFAGLASRRRWWRRFHPSRDSDCSNKERPGWLTEVGHCWKMEIFISKLTVWRKFLLTNPSGENNSRKQMFHRGGWAMGPYRKKRGRSKGIRRADEGSASSLSKWIQELDKLRFLEDPWEFMVVPVTATHFTMAAPPLLLICHAQNLLLFNKWPKSQHTRAHGCYFMVL